MYRPLLCLCPLEDIRRSGDWDNQEERQSRGQAGKDLHTPRGTRDTEISSLTSTETKQGTDLLQTEHKSRHHRRDPRSSQCPWCSFLPQKHSYDNDVDDDETLNVSWLTVSLSRRWRTSRYPGHTPRPPILPGEPPRHPAAWRHSLGPENLCFN